MFYAFITDVISIHALVKRATSDTRPVGTGRGHFNPRPRKEGDRSRKKLLSRESNFNPRPRKEGDIGGGTIPPPLIIISIHALVKRATIYDKLTEMRAIEFQSTPS